MGRKQQRELGPVKLCRRGHLSPKVTGGNGCCRLCKNESNRRTYHKNRECYLQKTNDYNSQHRQERRDYSKAYVAEHGYNLVTRLKAEHKRRALKRGSVSSFAKEDIARLIVRQRGMCIGCFCDITKNYTIDHVVALSKGGSNAATNIQLLCLSCNTQKGARSQKVWLKEKWRAK